MRILLLAAFSIQIAAGVMADPPDRSRAQCIDSIVRSIPAEQPITVVTNDSASIRGILPVVIPLSSSLCLLPVSDSGYRSSVLIPIGRINRIMYKKPSPLGFGLALLGLGIGAFAGGATGVALAPESKGWDFPEVTSGIIGGMIGGLIGAACGTEIGKHFKTTVVLQCR